MVGLDLASALASCYPLQADLCRRVIWFARIDRETYRRAGFLVPKHARMSEERYGFNLDDLLLHDLSLPIGGAPSHYVFISAFCCSTLLARLLDAVPGCFVLKEPGILGQIAMLRYRPRPAETHRRELDASRGERAEPDHAATAIPEKAGVPEPSLVRPLANDEGRGSDGFAGPAGAGTWEEDWQTWAALGVRLLTRTFEPGQTVIVKAADVCNTMGDAILANDPRSKAVLLSVGLRTFVLSVLKLENRREWTRKRTIFWHRALTLFPGLNEVNVPELDDACKAAYVWIVTAALWDRFRKRVEPERVLLMDGEEVSEAPGGALREVTAFFGLSLEESGLEEILASAVLSRHSKTPEKAYDAGMRRKDRADWEARFGADADRAMERAASIQGRLESEGVDFGCMAGAGLPLAPRVDEAFAGTPP